MNPTNHLHSTRGATPHLRTVLALAALAGASIASGETKHATESPATPVVEAPAQASKPPFEGKLARAGDAALHESKDALATTRACAIDRDRVYYADGADGAVHARGRSFKAEFGRERASFVPYFGSRAPRNFAVSFELESVAIGGQQIELARVAPERTGERVAYARGAVDEQYDLTPAGVEQRFVFESLPEVGDLEVRIGVDTELTAAADADGFVFSNELGSVRYGKATVLDGAGLSAPAETTLENGAIKIRVPVDFVARAHFPLTIDPVITSFAISADAFDDFAADVAVDMTSGIVATVYEEFFSSVDSDAFVELTNVDGVHVSGFYVEHTSEKWSHVRIANNRIAGQFLVVAEAGPIGSRQIKGRTVGAFLHELGPIVTIASNLDGEKTNPDVGGDPLELPPTFYCVVYERTISFADHDIHARLVDSTSTLVGPASIVVDAADSFDELPSISNSDGAVGSDEQKWTIVWQRRFNATDRDIRGAQITWEGVVVTPSFSIDGSAAVDTSPVVSPIIDSLPGPRRYLVAWERQFGTESDVMGALMTGTTMLDFENLSIADTSIDADVSQFEPALDTDGTQCVLAFVHNFGASDPDVHLATFSISDSIQLNEDALAGSSLFPERRPSLAAARSGGSGSRRVLAAWDRQLVASERDVFGASYEAPIGGRIEPFCFGTVSACPCGNAGAIGHGCASSVNANGAVLVASGVASLSHDSLVLAGSGMPAVGTCLYFQGSFSTFGVLGDGVRCAGGTVIRLGIKTNSSGNSGYPSAGDPHVSVRGLVPAIGGQRIYQAWYRNPAAFCTSATFNLTNALAAVWVP